MARREVCRKPRRQDRDTAMKEVRHSLSAMLQLHLVSDDWQCRACYDNAADDSSRVHSQCRSSDTPKPETIHQNLNPEA